MRLVPVFVCVSILLGSTVSPAAAQDAPGARATVRSFEAEGNLASSEPIETCIDLAELRDDHTPADIFPAVALCAEAGEIDRAVRLDAAGGVLGRFDQLRVTDETAHQAIDVLKLTTYDRLDEETRARFAERMGEMARDDEAVLAICEVLRELGPPSYRPDYMLRHGMSAFLGGGDGSGSLKSPFRKKRAWKKALNQYLHCDELDG